MPAPMIRILVGSHGSLFWDIIFSASGNFGLSKGTMRGKEALDKYDPSKWKPVRGGPSIRIIAAPRGQSRQSSPSKPIGRSLRKTRRSRGAGSSPRPLENLREGTSNKRHRCVLFEAKGLCITPWEYTHWVLTPEKAHFQIKHIYN